MNNLDKTYTDLLQDILDNGVEKKDRTGTGTLSVFGRQTRHKMSEGFPLLTTKKMHFKSVVTELLWFLRGDTNIKYLVDNDCHIWDGDAYKNFKSKTYPQSSGLNEFDKEDFIIAIKNGDYSEYNLGELGPIYGKQWRSWKGFQQGWNEMANTEYPNDIDTKGIDQIAILINDLKTNPNSRRLLVSSWNCSDLDQMVLPPCHYGFQVYTRELSHDERLPKKIKLTGHGGEIEFSLTDKREIKYYGKTKESNESLERVEKIKDNEVFYQTEFGWGVFLDTNTFETVSYNGTEWGGHKLNIPTRAISLMWNQRSVDTFLGLPFNIASYGLLLEIIAKEVNMVPEELIGNLGDVHLYSNHIEQAKEQIGRELTLEERTEYKMKRDNISRTFASYTHQMLDNSNVPTRTREPYLLPTLKHMKTDEFYKDLSEDLSMIGHLDNTDFQLENYQSHPTIKAPLSN